jgi:hypothetical protein
MRNKQKTPAEQLSEFLNFVEQSYTDYQIASEALKEEDRRLQDLLHEMEFAADKAERNRVATRLQKSRRERRKNKDTVKLNEQVVRFFEEKPHRDSLNKMKQLLGKQRKEEEYLFGERVYKQKAK